MVCNSFLCIAITSITTTATAATTTTTPPALISLCWWYGRMTSEKKDWIRIRRIAEKKEGGHKKKNTCVFFIHSKLYCNVEYLVHTKSAIRPAAVAAEAKDI